LPDPRRLELAAVQLDTDPIQSDRDVNVLVSVNADCHRPLHDLASSPSTWSTGPDRAVSSKGRRLLSGHRPVERVASPPVVSERPGGSWVAGSLLLDEASETATAGPQGSW